VQGEPQRRRGRLRGVLCSDEGPAFGSSLHFPSSFLLALAHVGRATSGGEAREEGLGL
jgi:hypothetical protein